ncbi:HET domain-containing protein [Fusarium keratoplasticum]|nr:HET domain-containing protein [Fusarium keratoplasticum]
MSAYTSTLNDTSFRLATVEMVSGVENNRNEPQIPSVTLTTYQISDATTPSYNALSYTWGPPRRNAPGFVQSDDWPILLNGEPFHVKTNLYDALLHLCQYCPRKLVWIDALCINQSNTAERQPQVSAMDRIYNGASTVLIWLGKPSAKLQLGLEIADRVGELAMREAKRIISNQRYDLSLSLGDMKRNYGMEPFALDEADGLVTLFESYWFSRVWVIQEVALAKEVGVFYGDGILSYDKIGATATFLHLTGLSIAVTTLVSIARGDNSVDPLDEVHIYQAERIQLLREWCRGGRSNWLDVLPLIDFSAGIEDDQLINRPGKGGSAGLILLKLLLWTVGFRAMDQRDVVYGLWGILQHMANAQGVEMPKHLRPNYDITAAELLQTVAREILETSGTLMLLTLVKDPSRRKTQGLPSWCPDFSPILDSHPLCGPKFKSVAKVNAGGCMTEMLDRLSLGEGGATLHLKGVSLGTVELIGESSDEIKDAKLEGWIKILSRMGQVYPPTGQSSFEAFWRTLIHDDDFSSRPAKLPQSENFRDMLLMLMVKRLHRVFEAGGAEAVTELIQSWKDLGLDNLAERYPHHIYGTSFLQSCCRWVGLLPETETEHLLPPEESAAWRQGRHASAAVFELLLGGTLFFRRIALTSERHLAHASESMSTGDEVWIVSGCPSPLVLRRVRSGRDRYCLISEGYVHGAMNGEVVANGVEWQDIILV